MWKPWYGVVIAFGILPLWLTGPLPMVDLPQHLHLISVLHRLDDPTTLYPQVFRLREGLTPYIGYYETVSLLHWLLPLEIANKVFLSVYVGGFCLSLRFLLQALGRPTWPALLTLPLAYGDSFAWGFVNFCAALPLVFFSWGALLRSITSATHPRRWAGAAAVGGVLVFLFHIQAYLLLGLGAPILIVLTPPPEGVSKRLAWGSLIPAALLALTWGLTRLNHPADIQKGVPWKAWGPLLSSDNLSFKTFHQNLEDLWTVSVNNLVNETDRWSFYSLLGCVLASWLAKLLVGPRDHRRMNVAETLRLPLLIVTGLSLFFILPFDVRGYIYYLNTRYAHPTLALALCLVPHLHARWSQRFEWGAALIGIGAMVPLCLGYRDFGQEAADLVRLSPYVSPRPKTMGLIYNPFSRVVRHPVYLHSAAFLAREGGGIANFSFALTPHSPIEYRAIPPPTYPSEWHPEQFRLDAQGGTYDHFLVRGMEAERIFGQLPSDKFDVERAGSFSLVKRR